MRKEILEQLQTVWAGRPWLHFETLDSTNEYVKRLAGKQPVHGLLVTADSQSAGKGRRGRVWQSPPETNIYMSLCVEPEFPADRAAGLTLVMALAAAEAVQEVTGTRPGIKWPNDLVLGGKKICGILTELILRDNAYAVVTGVGMNVNAGQFFGELQETAGSLQTELGATFSRAQLIASVLKYFEVFYAQYEQTGDLTFCRERYEQSLVNLGKEVRVLDPRGAYTGMAEGITNTGALIVTDETGTVHLVDSGEVSVRGLYGYV